MALTLRSDSFSPDGSIPSVFTCEGEGRSPHLAWSGAPEGVKSLALIVDDPDAPDPSAPQRTWVHWVVYGIPPTTHELPENASSDLPAGIREGVNDSRRIGYGPPCPPIGRHRYVFKLYALDSTLSSLDKPSKDELVEAMQGHILSRAQLIGTYEKQAGGRR
jgi:Raf kinase inhibitor-like YbhB/YbcL family protein